MQTIENENLVNELSRINNEESIIVEIDLIAVSALSLLVYQLESLEAVLHAIRNNRYGLFKDDDLVALIEIYRGKKDEKNMFFWRLVSQVLGIMNAKKFLNQNDLKCVLNEALGTLVFSKFSRNTKKGGMANEKK